MKYTMDVHEFSFNKIKNGSRKISVHLLDKSAQQIKLYDVLEMRNISTNETLSCKIKGIAIFDNFKDLVDALGAESLGYDNKQEVLIRLSRIYPENLRNNLNSVAFFIEPQIEWSRVFDRGEIER